MNKTIMQRITSNARCGVGTAEDDEILFAFVADNYGLENVPLGQPCFVSKKQYETAANKPQKDECSDLYPGRDEGARSSNGNPFNYSYGKSDESYVAPPSQVTIGVKFAIRDKRLNFTQHLKWNQLHIADDIYANMFNVIKIDDFKPKTSAQLKSTLKKHGASLFVFENISEYKKALEHLLNIAEEHKSRTFEYFSARNEPVNLTEKALFVIELYNVDLICPIINPRKVDGMFAIASIKDRGRSLFTLVLGCSNFKENIYTVDGCTISPIKGNYSKAKCLRALDTLSLNKDNNVKIKEKEAEFFLMDTEAVEGVKFPEGTTIMAKPDNKALVTLPPGIRAKSWANRNLNLIGCGVCAINNADEAGIITEDNIGWAVPDIDVKITDTMFNAKKHEYNAVAAGLPKNFTPARAYYGLDDEDDDEEGRRKVEANTIEKVVKSIKKSKKVKKAKTRTASAGIDLADELILKNEGDLI